MDTEIYHGETAVFDVLERGGAPVPRHGVQGRGRTSRFRDPVRGTDGIHRMDDPRGSERERCAEYERNRAQKPVPPADADGRTPLRSAGKGIRVLLQREG